MQEAVNAAASGDVILLAPGTYPGGIFVHDKIVVIASQFYVTGDTSYIAQTVLYGYGDYCDGFSGCRGDAVMEFGDNTDGSAVIGLTIRDEAVGQYGPYGTKGVRSRSFVDIDYCHVIYTDDGTNYTGGSGGTISNSLFAYNHDDGVDLNSDVHVRVINNIIRDNRDDGVEFRMNPYSGPTTTIEFIGNLVTGNGEDGIQLIDYPDSSHRVVRLAHNVFENNAMAALGFMADALTDQDFGGPQIPERVELINNTFIGGDYHVSGGGNLVAINNIFTGAASYALWRAGTHSTAAYNLFWNNAVDAAESNLDPTGNVHADPVLGDDRTLIPSSPAVDAGAAFFQWRGQTILDLQPSDYEGPAPDLGATELNLSVGGLPSMSIADVGLDELDSGMQNADFEVRLSHVTTQTVTVSYTTVDGTATVSDQDYAARSGVLTIPPNTLIQTISVPVNGDDISEDDEAFTIVLSNVTNASILRGTGRCTILNDDGLAASVESRVAASSDDAEESPSGNVSLTSSDIEMMNDNSSVQRAVGFRFAGLEVPQGVTVVDAWIQFRSKETWAPPTSLTFRAQAADDAPTFVAVSGGLTSLPVTNAQVIWPDVPEWPAGESGSAERTPNLKSVIQEVVDRPGWTSGNALAVLVTGSGHRTAYSYDGNAESAALLHVMFAETEVDTSGIDRAPVAALASFPVEGAAPFLVRADGTPSADPDGDPLTYTFDFGDGTVVGPVETPVATHTYAEGTWVLTLTVASGGDKTDVVATPIIVHRNLVLNSSMETDMAGWNANGPGASVARIAGGHDGSFCIEARGGGTSLSSFGVNDSPNWLNPAGGVGARYHFSAWVRSETHLGRAHLQVREYLDGVLQATTHSEYLDLKPYWQEVAVEADATVDGSTLDFQILNKPVVFEEVFEVDQISAWQVNAPVLSAPRSGPEDAIAFGARVAPNPLAANATLSLVTTRAGFARVRLYDSQGRLVHALLDEPVLPAGRHTLHFETRALRSRFEPGLYFYSVQAAEGRLSGKFVVVK